MSPNVSIGHLAQKKTFKLYTVHTTIALHKENGYFDHVVQFHSCCRKDFIETYKPRLR